MSEIEKMYKNAGINAISQKTKDCNYCYYYEETYDAPCHVCTADKCPFEKNIIPPFTAEKQLELIEWLGELQIDTRKGYWHLAKFGRTTKTIYADNGNSGEALSEIVNQLWQSLTDIERKQIRGILK
jgi:hypothetical protein